MRVQSNEPPLTVTFDANPAKAYQVIVHGLALPNPDGLTEVAVKNQDGHAVSLGYWPGRGAVAVELVSMHRFTGRTTLTVEATWWTSAARPSIQVHEL